MTFAEWMIENQSICFFRSFEKNDKEYKQAKRKYKHSGIRPIEIYSDNDDMLFEAAARTISTVINLSLENGNMREIAYQHSPEDKEITNEIMNTIDVLILRPLEKQFNELK